MIMHVFRFFLWNLIERAVADFEGAVDRHSMAVGLHRMMPVFADVRFD